MPTNYNLDQPIARVSQKALIIVIWLLAGLSILFVALRTGIRLSVFRKLFVDDGFVALALLFLIANSAVTTLMTPPMYELLAVSVGQESPTTEGFLARGSFYLKSQFTSTLLFWSCLWSVKAAFLAFFRQLTTDLLWPRRLWWFVAVFTGVAYIGAVITYPISCTSFVIGDCQEDLNVQRSLISLRYSTAVDIISDICIMAIPILIVAPVQISRIQKIALIAVLSLGVIIIGFSVTRIVVTNKQDVHPEISWLALWSSIESSVAVIVACLASFKTFFVGREHSRGSENGRQYYGSANVSRGEDKRNDLAYQQPYQSDVTFRGAEGKGAVPLTSVRKAKMGDRGAPKRWQDDSSSQWEILGDFNNAR